VATSGNVDTTTPGAYVITYSASDSEGLTTTETRDVNVIIPLGIKKTGQTTSYSANDDGDHQIGVDPSYTRDDTAEIVTDHITQLMWQDDAEAASPTGIDQNTSKQRCSNLPLGGFDDWRVPTIEELLNIVDKGKFEPAIDPVFQNTISLAYYWSSSDHKLRSGQAWTVYFEEGTDHYRDVTLTSDGYGTGIVRCVRNK
ncbi:MAG: DUF1566 domain-containing protein, partial [Chlamydiia bacterium]|nr:DUF1566 domain-containing protein [Chlamydiia bacterium]